jgi:hypothetical protein
MGLPPSHGTNNGDEWCEDPLSGVDAFSSFWIFELFFFQDFGRSSKLTVLRPALGDDSVADAFAGEAVDSGSEARILKSEESAIGVSASNDRFFFQHTQSASCYILLQCSTS